MTDALIVVSTSLIFLFFIVPVAIRIIALYLRALRWLYNIMFPD